MQDGYAVNLARWDERASAHAASPEYGVARFVTEPDFISNVVAFDLPRLGDVSGLTGIHLQCHIGTDTLSLSRLGARMTGLDFSGASLAEARELARHISVDADFVQANVYDAPAAVGERRFDFVFTGIGALCWLPDVKRWAQVVAELLQPGGWLFLREGHPMLWSIDERESGQLVVGYPYFEHDEPLILNEEGTYVQTTTEFEHNGSYSWNHGLGEIVSALLIAGLEITMLVEHDTVPWEALPGQMVEAGDGEWRLADRPERLPLTYTLRARKPV